RFSFQKILVHVRAVHLQMANRTVAKARTAQIVKRGRRHSDGGIGWPGYRQIRVAVQTDQKHLLPNQHARIRRTVRLVTSGAAFQPDGGVLEGEWSTLLAMAAEASSLVGIECANGSQQHTAVRIVAIRAAHRTLRQLVSVRTRETQPLR